MTDEKPLHVQVAEALGWTDVRQTQTLYQVRVVDEWKTPVKSFGHEGCPPRMDTHRSVPHYDTDWSVIGPLIERYVIRLQTLSTGEWAAETFKRGGVGATPLLAVCNLIVTLAKEGRL